jgi:energy-coupling factor transport system permease protein
MIASMIAGLLVHYNTTMLAIFLIALIWLVIAGKGEGLFGYIVLYAVLWGITELCVMWLSISPAASVAISLSNIGLMGRRAFPALLFALLLAKQPTGSLLASFYALHLPKAFGIGVATMLRFFPTLSQEYRSIRNAQKFRGLGVGFWNTLAHLPKVLSHILIPLVIRVTKIAEELSASVTVRGVRFHNEVVSFRPIRFRKKDTAALLVTLTVFAVVLLVNRLLGVSP